MESINNNEATQFIENKMFEYNFEEDDFPGRNDMEKLDGTSNFLEYIHKYSSLCGYSDGLSDAKKLSKFVKERCKKENITIDTQTIDNWILKGTFPANTANNREKIYKLCFALKMNAQQTTEFFLKAFFERPFNYKNIHEAVYFFCLNNGLNYTEAINIIEDIESQEIIENVDADNITEYIGKEIYELETKEQLIKYLLENRFGFVVQNNAATEKVKQLIESCKKIAPQEYLKSYNETLSHWKIEDKKEKDRKIVVDNIDELLNVIYGFSARATYTDEVTGKIKHVHEKSISKSKFPKLIKRNWPQREQFEQILKNEASYDVIRRALIMLTFYDFSARATISGAIEYGIFDEFTDEMNYVLSECGYVQLYWRNPFDWMIGYCAQAPNPLGTLRDLIDEYYLSDVDKADE